MKSLSPSNALRYILAGHGLATLVGREHRYTYKFSVPQENKGQVVYVNLLTNHDQVYLGYIKDGRLIAGKAGRAGHKAFQALAWYLHQVQHKPEIAEQAQFMHEGTCAFCGKALTAPESIDRGIGPECWKRYVD